MRLDGQLRQWHKNLFSDNYLLFVVLQAVPYGAAHQMLRWCEHEMDIIE